MLDQWGEVGQLSKTTTTSSGGKLRVPAPPAEFSVKRSGPVTATQPPPKYVPPELTIAALEQVALQILSPEEIAIAQESCPDVKAHKSGNMPKNVITADVKMLGTTLHCEISDSNNPRPLLPAKQRDTVVNLLHHGDHPSIKETIRRVAQDYYWPSLRKNIREFALTCHPCQLAKQAKTVNPGIGEFKVPDSRFSVIHLDIVGPLPKSHDGFRYLLTCFDRTSRWFEAYPLRQDTASEIATAFMEWISRFGVCDWAVSDNGNAFVSRLFQEIMDNFNIKVSFTPAYHAATNGAIERQHQTMKNSLKAALVDMGNDHRDQWTKALPWVLLGKRVQYQPFLDSSSAQLVLGKSPKLPGQLVGEPGPPLNTIETRALLDQLYKLHDRPGIKMSSKVTKFDITNTNSATHVYVKVDKPESLCSRFEGPYRIHSRPSRSTIEVELGKRKDGSLRLLTYHWSSAKVAHMREGARIAERPKLGRPPKSVIKPGSSSIKNSGANLRKSVLGEDTGTTSECQQTTTAGQPISDPDNNQPITGPNGASSSSTAKIQTSRRSTRTSRNPEPRYVDVIESAEDDAVWKICECGCGDLWSPAELATINSDNSN